MLQKLRYRNKITGAETEYKPVDDTFGVFVLAGYTPATDLVKGIAELDEQGYVITDKNQRTNVEGLYAAGDVCIKPLRQIVTAVGDGALAATELERYAAQLQKKTGYKPELQRQTVEGKVSKSEDSVFSAEIVDQLTTVFDKMEKPLILKLSLDDRAVSTELRNYMEHMASLTDKVTVEIAGDDSKETERPCVRVYLADGTDTGLAFHGVPGGHEFTSFVLGLYNASGPGQTIDENLLQQIASIDKEVNLQIMVSLSCTMCPELVTAAQKIASLNPLVKAEVYDLNHFPERKDKYQVMSVPCFTMNDGKPVFGKKNIQQLLELIDRV